MAQTKDNKLNIENRRKHRISLKRSRSVVSINSNISDRMSSPLIRQISFKKRRADLETKSYQSNYDKSNSAIDGNLTSLNVHDSKGNIVTDNEVPSNKADISHLHFGVDYESSSSNINASSNLTVDFSKNNFIPSARPPKTPSIKSPVLDDWDSYNFIPSGSSNAESCLTANSIPNSISDSISSFVKRIPKGIRSSKATNSSSLSESSHWENYDSESFIVEDVIHAHRNRLQVKLNKVITHSNKRWSNIFQKRRQAENAQEVKQSIPLLYPLEDHEKFKSPPKVHVSSETQKKPAVHSLIKCDSNIVPQKILISNTKENHTKSFPDSRSTYSKPNTHYVKRVTKQVRTTNAAERPNDERSHLVRKEQIFSPNIDLKDSANSPTLPEQIQGFSSLTIKDFLQDANLTN